MREQTKFVQFFPLFLSVSFLSVMRQQWLSPIGPRIPTVEAHPTAMPPDTESDEEHKATKAYPESPGDPTHKYTHTEGKHKYIHKGEQAQSARHVQCTYEHANRHKSRWMQSFTGKLTHTHWHSFKSIVSHGPTQTQTRWYSLAKLLAITSDM